jgi:hypothetical protein
MKASPNLNDVLLGDTLLRLVREADEEKRCKLTLPQADFLKVYASYLQNQTQASDTLVRCEQSMPAFATFLKECMADQRCRGLSFLSFLIKPTQRIAKYPLFMKVRLQSVFLVC